MREMDVSERWRRRFNYFRSPLLRPATHRILLILVVVGIVLIATVPESALILPALDAVGWDVVTLFVVFELRHHFGDLAHLVRLPAVMPLLRFVRARVVSRFKVVLIGSPLRPYYHIPGPFILAAVLIEAVRVWLRSRT
jgi:hypothetical protein